MEIEMKKMTWQEFNDRKDEAVVILPIGSLEQHGPHLPLSLKSKTATIAG